MIKRGDRGIAVRIVQRSLKRWDDALLPEHGVDDSFGGETVQAVQAYQRACNLEPTGIVDGTTMALLARWDTMGYHRPPPVEVPAGTLTQQAADGRYVRQGATVTLGPA